MSYQIHRTEGGSLVVTSVPSRNMRIGCWGGVVGFNVANSVRYAFAPDSPGWLIGLVVGADIVLVLLVAISMASTERLEVAGSEVTASVSAFGRVLRKKRCDSSGRPPKFVGEESVLKLEGSNLVRLDGTGFRYGQYLESGESIELADRLNDEVARRQCSAPDLSE